MVKEKIEWNFGQFLHRTKQLLKNDTFPASSSDVFQTKAQPDFK